MRIDSTLLQESARRLKCSPAGSAEPLRPVGVCKTQNPKTGSDPKVLFAGIKNSFDQGADVGANKAGRSDKVFRRLFEIALMRKGPVLLYGRELAYSLASQMARDSHPLVVTFNDI